MKIYTVRKTSSQEIISIAATFTLAEEQADIFYFYQRVDCFISLEYI